MAEAVTAYAVGLQEPTIEAQMPDCYNGKYDRSVLIAALKSKKPSSIRNKIITDCEHPQNIRFAHQIMLAYNAKSDKALPELKHKDKQ